MSESRQLLLGDNPFFGVDNLSQERARQRRMVLNGYDKIADVMKYVSNLGVKGFVVSTHPQLKDLVKYLGSNTDLLEKFSFYPILPYAQGYVSKVAENGLINGMSEILSMGTTQDRLKIIFKGSIGFLKKDFTKLLQTFIDVELMPLHNVKKNTVFLHDGLTDLSIGLNMKKVIEMFLEYVSDQYGVNVGLVTKNFPRLIKTFETWNIKLPTIMTSFNPIGYQMNPSKQECENYLGKAKVIAMNVLAAGYIKPEQAFEYISKLNIDSIVIGMSTKEHAQETVMAFNRLNK